MRFRIAFLCATFFLAAWAQTRHLEPQTDRGVFSVEPQTPYIHYTPASASKGRVLVVHGLDVSKETMQLLSAALADGGFEVYAIDLPGHGDSGASFEPQAAETAVGEIYEQLGRGTLVVGHSLGAGLLLDLAFEKHFSKMALLSPPPTPIDELHAERVLVVTGAWEPPRIREFGAVLLPAAVRVESVDLKWGAHSSAILQPQHIRTVVAWLGGDGERTQTGKRIMWISTMLATSCGLGIALMPGKRLEPQPWGIPGTIVRYVTAFACALLALSVFNPLAFLRLFATDYLIGFLFLTGVALWAQRRPLLTFDATAFMKALAAAAFVIGVIGFFIGSNVFHMTLSDGRWWRFPVITAAGFFLFSFDEGIVRRIASPWRGLVVALVTRALLWAFLLVGVLMLHREASFLVLVAHLMVLFWLLLWLATGVVHRNTGNSVAAALFASIVQGWAFAAWFVTI